MNELPQCDCTPMVPHSHANDCPIMKDIEEQLNTLGRADHAILSKEQAERIAYPFGVKPHLTSIRDERSQFKGAYFPHLKEGEWAKNVVDSANLARQLCNEIGVDYRSMEGRGSALAECVDKLRKYWGISK